MADDLHTLLQSYSAETLTTIASYQSLLPARSRARAILTERLSERFSSAGHVHKAYEALSPPAREAVDTLLRAGGRASGHAIQRALALRGLLDPPAPPTGSFGFSPRAPAHNKADSRRLDEIMAHLAATGLAFGVYAPNSYAPVKLLDFGLAPEYVIPQVVRQHLPPPSPAPPPPPLAAPSFSQVEESSARTFQRDLFLYWSYVQANQSLGLTMKGELYKRDLTGINDSLLVRETIGTGEKESSFPRLVFLRSMLEGLGLLQRVTDTGSVITSPDTAFFRLDPAERLKRCLESYATGNWINELDWYPSVYRDSQSAPVLPAPALVGDARRAVLLHLKASDGWTGIASLAERVQHLDYEFLFKRQGQQIPSPYYYGMPQHPYHSYSNPLRWQFNAVSNDADGWQKVEGAFIQHIITRPLYWMGLVDLAYAGADTKAARPAALVAFRLTPVGAWLLGAGPAPEIPVEGGQVILQPNFQITAFDPISDAVLMTLGLFAERLSVDRTAEFRLTRASVYRGQKQGWPVARIKAYLQEQTGAPAPANVARTLDEWQAQHERITIHPRVSLIHAATPADLDAVMDDAELARQVAARPDPAVARLASQGKVDALVEALLACEQLPLVTRRAPGRPGAGDHLPPCSVVAGEDGRLRFTAPVADLYLHGHLARFADPDGTGYRLTPASVGRAARAGLGAPEVLAALQQVLRDPLPQALDLRIRAWSGHYGEAALQQVALLQVQDAATLKELLADPDLGPLLKPFRPTPSHPLALVAVEDLQRARELLAERGVDLGGRLS